MSNKGHDEKLLFGIMAVAVDKELEVEWIVVDALTGVGESHVEDECPLSGLHAVSAINLKQNCIKENCTLLLLLLRDFLEQVG